MSESTCAKTTVILKRQFLQSNFGKSRDTSGIFQFFALPTCLLTTHLSSPLPLPDFNKWKFWHYLKLFLERYCMPNL